MRDYELWGRYYRFYAAELNGLDRTGVDEAVLSVARMECYLVANLSSTAYHLSAFGRDTISWNESEYRRRAEANSEAIRRYSIMTSVWQQLCIFISEKYGVRVSHPYLYTRNKTKKVDAERKPHKVDAEVRANQLLYLAKQLIAKGKTDAARRRLNDIVFKFPDTSAAKEAAELLQQ